MKFKATIELILFAEDEQDAKEMHYSLTNEILNFIDESDLMQLRLVDEEHLVIDTTPIKE